MHAKENWFLFSASPCSLYFFVCFCASLDYLGFVLLVLLVLVFVSVQSQEIGWAERLRNDLFVSIGT